MKIFVLVTKYDTVRIMLLIAEVEFGDGLIQRKDNISRRYSRDGTLNVEDKLLVCKLNKSIYSLVTTVRKVTILNKATY